MPLLKMELIRVVLFLIQLWSVLAFECPKECTCGKAEVGGYIAHCSQLHEDQRFSNYIQHLNITNADPNKILSLKRNIFDIVNLKELNSIKIINSSLQSIDVEAFKGLDNLRYVDLSDNDLIFIHPDTFRNNTNLNQLSLSGNPLQLTQTLKSKLNYFLYSPSLTELDLSNCQLNKIADDTFNQLPSLINVNLESNNIQNLSKDVFNKLEYVEEINLCNNALTVLDIDLFEDNNDLVSLNLSNNTISDFYDIEIIGLRELDLSHNRFTSVKASTLEGGMDLVQINLSHNEISSIADESFSSLPLLKNVDLSYNHLRGPLSEFLFEANKELETLSFARNQDLKVFSYFSSYLAILFSLDISYCGLTELKKDAFKNMDSLTTLNLNGNELTYIDPEAFAKLTLLNTVDLSDNKLESLPKTLFSNNRDLRKLHIAGNKIHHMPAAMFDPIPHLTVLDARRCHLSYLWNMDESKYMKEKKILSELRYLNLEDNRFKTLHKHNFESMANLKTLDISRNQFQCDDSINYLMQWLIGEKITPVKYIGKSSADMIHEHAQLHWGDMLSQICRDESNIIKKPTLLENTKEKVDRGVAAPNNPDPEYITNLPLFGIHKMPPGMENNAEDILRQDSTHYFTLPDSDYTNDDLQTQRITNSSVNGEYPWLWPLFLILVCGISILLALFNLAALFFYRAGRNYKVAGYRSTFVTPLSGHMKTKRDAGSFYHKLYEECSVPNTMPIVKSNTEAVKDSTRKVTIITSGATHTKGEDMV